MDKLKIIMAGIVMSGACVFVLNFLTQYPSEVRTDFSNLNSKIKYVSSDWYRGIAVINLDEDKDFEYILSGFGVPNIILKNSGFNLKEVNDPILEDSFGLTQSLTACDLDGDGFNEIFALNTRLKEKRNVSKNRLFKRINNKWTDLLADIERPLGERGIGAICIDRNDDNLYELLILKSNEPVEYLELRDGRLYDIASSIGVKSKGNNKSAIVIPDDAGSSNIFIGNEDGPNFFYKINKDGTFQDYSSESGLSDPSQDARGISLIDYNNDKLIDLVYGNDSGPTRIFIQEKGAKFKEVTPKVFQEKFFVSAVAVEDFNLDGRQDIYLNNRSGRNMLFYNLEEAWQEVELNTDFMEEKKVGTSTLVGDILFDGAIELLNSHGLGESREQPTLYSFHNNNKWLTIIPVLKNGGIAKNAVVILRTSQGQYTRVISDGSSPYSRSMPQAHFAVGSDEYLKSVQIIYRNTIKQIDAAEFELNRKKYIEI